MKRVNNFKTFAVIGLGGFGEAVALELAGAGYEVLVIDTKVELIQKVADDVTCAVMGDAKDKAVLRAAGINNFDCVVVATAGSVENSVLVTLMLKDMGVPYVVAKAQSQLHAKVLARIGADRVIFPEHDMGRRLAQTLISSKVIDLIELSDSYSIMEIDAPTSWRGRSLGQINVRAAYGVTVMAVRKSDQDLVISPPADYVVEPQDELIVVGQNDVISTISQ